MRCTATRAIKEVSERQSYQKKLNRLNRRRSSGITRTSEAWKRSRLPPTSQSAH